MDLNYQINFVSRQYASYFLGVSASKFDDLMLEIPGIRTLDGFRYRRYSFHDLARLIKPNATDLEIATMRVVANIHYAGVKRNGTFWKEKKKGTA